MSAPPAEVLDLFAVPGDPTPLGGGRGSSYRAGDLVLSPGRDEAVHAWLSPVLARLAVRLDEDPARRPRDLRVALPVPARDGSWVVGGWAASRYEPGAVTCDDVDVTLAAGRLLHAQLAVAVPARPPGLDDRDDQWVRAERLAFGPAEAMVAAVDGGPAADVVRRLLPLLDDTPLGDDQLVHVDLAGSVLLDSRGAPFVVDVSPAWRPVRWAEAIAAIDSVVRLGAPASTLGRWMTTAAERQALARAVLYRAFADRTFDLVAYAPVLALIAST